MSIPVIQTSFISGELAPSFLGRTDKPQYRNGGSTMRNYFVNYRGGASSRAGFAYVGMCKQGAPNAGGTATANPPRDINFQYNINQGFALEFGDQYMRVKFQGSYITESAKNVTAITRANPGVITSAGHGFNNGDWVFASSIGGMTEFNGLTWIVHNKTTNTFQLTDLFGNIVDTTSFLAFTSGGTFARIYTAVSPYAAIDLPYLKFTQSANIMNLVCWNQQTNTEYPPYNLQRVSDDNWTFTQVVFSATISPPSSVSAAATNSTTMDTWYSYIVTSIDQYGNESIASSKADVFNNDISINAGSNTITWSNVTDAVQYNIYSATPVFVLTPFADPGFVGVQYGLLGTAFGLSFTDTNIVADFTQTPPTHTDPFARGTIQNVVPTAAGTGYSQATIGYTVTTSTGTGFVGTPIVTPAGTFGGFLIENGGENYANTDTIAITGGTGGTATLTIGSQSGTYPGTVQYYQQRLVYADTINQPDTYFMSQTGLYANFDSSIPVIDSDAITGTPWGQQINGIQFLVPTINGLLTFTGNGVWLINGGSNVAITPSDQNAQAQAQIGCSAIVPPIYINLHVLYVQAKNSIVRDISYNFYFSVFQGTDITVFSSHLFFGYTLLQWAYAEEPWKVVWAVRDDGVLLSLTYVKEQEVEGWARHDTNGLFVGVCSVIEPPVDAVYVITKRYIVGEGVWAYYSERADNRQWENVEDCFCVDAGLAYPMSYPNATLTPASITGANNITSTNLISGGSNFTAPVIAAIDPTGLGSGATFSATVVGGVITALTVLTQGQDYAQGTYLEATDVTGTGFVAQAIVTNYINFTASSNVFSSGMVGDVIRVDGGKATIVSYVSATEVVANVTQILTTTIPNDPNFLPVPAVSGNWSISTPVSTVTGLNHLEGMTVSILADGGVMPQQIVTNGSITLQQPASQITIGLPFTCQLQSMYLEVPSQTTTQGKRKDIQAVTVRVEGSRGFSVGTNQPDQSTQPNNATIPWTNMKEVKERNALITAGSNIPLFTGDIRILVPGDWVTNGQVAVQNIYPLPSNILALVPETSLGDPSA